MKTCVKCKETKLDSAFYKRADKNRKHILRSECIQCHRLRDKRPWSKRRLDYLKRLYGITEDEYQAMYEAQKGLCYICGGEQPSGQLLCVDHNHNTGQVRKLLCRRCNAILGLVYEDPNILESMAEYLRMHTAASSDFTAERYVKDLIS